MFGVLLLVHAYSRFLHIYILLLLHVQAYMYLHLYTLLGSGIGLQDFEQLRALDELTRGSDGSARVHTSSA